MITYENIIQDLQAHDFSKQFAPHTLKTICKRDGIICEETTGVQVYAPSISKGRYLDFIQTLFAGRGLTITYLPNSEMIHIEIPVAKEERIDVFEKMKMFEPKY